MFSASQLTKASKMFLYAVGALPLLLFARFSFPYVTVRTAIFRVIIELAVMILLWLHVKSKISQQNLRQAYLLWALAGLLAVELLAAIFGASWRTSIFSDLERMWGVFTVGHLFIFFYLLRAWFTDKDWTYFFRVSLITSLLVSFYGIVQHFPDAFGIYVFEAGASRIPSTLGNPTYVAMYLVFNLAFGLYLLTKSQDNWRWFYYLSLFINFYTFTLTDIRGAYLGLISGGILSAFLYLWKSPIRRHKVVAGTIIVTVALIGVMIFAIAGSRRVGNIPIIKRLSTISLQDGSVQTRFIGWNAAWQGFKERPLLGVGMENYNLLFNKYFPARYYNLAPSETYFDRSHNHYLNLLAESGILALLLYLFLPLLAGFYLWRGYRLSRFSLAELSIFSATITAYLVHIFFVFEEINTALFFVAVMAFIDHRYRQGSFIVLHRENISSLRHSKILAATGIVILVFFVFSLNWKILRAARVNAAAYLTEDASKKLGYYSQSLAMDIIPSRNLTAGYADYLMSLSDKIDGIKKDEKLKGKYSSALQAVMKALQREIAKKPDDVFLYLKLAQLQNVDFLFSGNKSQVQSAIANLKQAISLSPGRLQLYYVLGESYVIAEDSAAAIDILRQAVDLNPAFGASYYYLGRAFLTADDLEKGYDNIINKALGEYRYAPDNNIVLLALGESLAGKGDYGRVIKVYEAIINREKDKKIQAQFLAALAAAYVQAGDQNKAIESAKKAAELDPSFMEEADYFIEMIQTGRLEELKKSTQ